MLTNSQTPRQSVSSCKTGKERLEISSVTKIKTLCTRRKVSRCGSTNGSRSLAFYGFSNDPNQKSQLMPPLTAWLELLLLASSPS